MDAASATYTLDDVTLVRRAQGGDRTALAALVDRYYGLVHGCGYRRVRNRADAEDVAQDVMVKLGQAIFKLKDPLALRGYLLRLTINAVTDLFRSRTRDSQRDANYLVDPSLASDDYCETEKRFDALWNAVRQLPQQQREAVLLVYADGASHREAAQALGCAETTISYHIHAAKKRLKELLKEDA